MKSIFENYKSYFEESNSNVKIFLGIILIASVSVAAYNVLVGIYMKNMGFNEEAVGQILSLRTLGIAFGAIPIAVLTEQYNKKNALRAGLLIMLFCGLMMINTRTFWIMQFASFFFGIGHATLMVLQTPILYENSSDGHKVTAFSAAFVIQNIAFVFGSFFLGHLSELLAKHSSEKIGNLLVLNGATLLIVIPIVMTAYFSGESMTAQKRTVPFRQTGFNIVSGYCEICKGKALLYLLQVAFVGFGAGLIVPFFSMYLKYALNVMDGIVGTIMAISQVGTILGGLLVPIISRKWGRVRTVIWCQLLSVPFLISISMPQGIYIITLSFFFRSSLMNMANPIIKSLSMDLIGKDERTYMSSLVSLTNNLFRSMGIYFGGIIMYTVSYNAPYYVTIICYLGGTFILYKVFGNKKEDYSTSK
ncbi:MFS transporter [Fusibacter ferrireducens]|uniref:MFS transporter n=1 Tax=Fusibacter ferrireducens TaxID=2785058 RepID=A0ABR9ZWG5_9FIRM|nr:MFS transporter [Fusibacter ferrireducens]MBF4694790.1 MFS transporter [Fusibacter ferrireducens]